MFLFSSCSSHLSTSHSHTKVPGGRDADLWFKPHFPVYCVSRVWSHGIAISPERQYGFGQLQAAVGSLIRVSVMSPHLTCWRCHVLKVWLWGHAPEADPPQFKTKVLFSVQLLRSDQFQQLCLVFWQNSTENKCKARSNPVYWSQSKTIFCTSLPEDFSRMEN